MTIRACTKCGRPTANGNRCAQHPAPTRGRPHRTASAGVMANATVCWICGKPPKPGDPLTRDHVLALDNGGTNTPSNYRAAHYSCNSRRGSSS